MITRHLGTRKKKGRKALLRHSYTVEKKSKGREEEQDLSLLSTVWPDFGALLLPPRSAGVHNLATLAAREACAAAAVGLRYQKAGG